MIVTREIFHEIVRRLSAAPTLSVDCETTGLRAYHDDRLFSIIIAARTLEGEVFPCYFNFLPYPNLQPEELLLPEHLSLLRSLFSDEKKTWYAHNAKFDLAMLAREGIEVAGTIHCTQAIARIVYNDHPPGTYDLANCAERIGFEKDDAVEKYIEEHKLWSWSDPAKPGDREKIPHYDRVPFDIIVPYGERDATICFHLGEFQKKALGEIDAETQKEAKKKNRTLPSVLAVQGNERRLTKTVHRMEQTGVLIDRPYCMRAARYETDRSERARAEFTRLTGQDFVASAKTFSIAFASDKERWQYTDKGNPSFTSEVLQSFAHPGARCVLDFRDAKSKSDFYRGFVWHADAQARVHPTFNPSGAATGRFSSSNPNFQNLTSEEDEAELAQEFVVRRAIIPSPGYVFIMPDWSAMEYRLMAEYAAKFWGRETEMVGLIKAGHDPHQATADIVSRGGTPLTRKRAKNANFCELYGGGVDTLAKTAGCTRDEATQLKSLIRTAMPEMRQFTDTVMATARTRGFIRNWAGRRCYLSDPNRAYAMPNYLIQGGCADVVKFAMNKIDEYLEDKKSRLVMCIHDELPVEVHESEIGFVPQEVQKIMETVFPAEYLPLICDMEWSPSSLADKRKGLPSG